MTEEQREQASATEQMPGAAQVTTALEELAGDLPRLPMDEHHDRYAAVLELLQRVLEDERPAGDPDAEVVAASRPGRRGAP